MTGGYFIGDVKVPRHVPFLGGGGGAGALVLGWVPSCCHVLFVNFGFRV